MRPKWRWTPDVASQPQKGSGASAQRRVISLTRLRTKVGFRGCRVRAILLRAAPWVDNGIGPMGSITSGLPSAALDETHGDLVTFGLSSQRRLYSQEAVGTQRHRCEGRW